MRDRVARWAALFVATATALALSGAAPAKPFGTAVLDGIRVRLENELQSARFAQSENRKTAEASRGLADRARAAKNPAAAADAERAAALAEEALRKNALREARATKALGWVERLTALKAAAPPVAGFMPRVEGTVEIRPAGGGPPRRVTADTPPVLGPGDTLQTGQDGRADLLLPEGDSINLAAGSAATLAEHGLESFLGVLRAKIKKDFAKKFEVRTPTFALAVRGTEFVLREQPGKPPSVVVLEGTVAFSDRGGRKTVLVGAGQQSYLLPDGTPAEPAKANLQEMRRWWEE